MGLRQLIGVGKQIRIKITNISLAVMMGASGLAGSAPLFLTQKVSASNHLPAVVINEIYSPATGDWVELYNTTGNVVDLGSGWELTQLTSPDTTPTEVDLLSLSGTIPGKGVLAINVSLLNQSGDSVGLYHSAVLIDRVTYGTVAGSSYPTTTGLGSAVPLGSQSLARVYNGAETWNIGDSSKDANNLGPTETLENVFVVEGGTGTDCTDVYPCGSISSAVSRVAAGGTVNVAAGTYTGRVDITKSLSLRGANTGINPLTSSRVAETFLNAPGDTALNILVPDIEVDGFSINAAIGIDTQSGVSTSGVTIQNNVITGTSRAVSLHSVGIGTDTSVLNNDLISNSRSLHVSGGSFMDLAVNGNRFSGTASTGVQFLGPGVPINGFEFMDNQVFHLANIGSNITDGMVSGNIFNIAAPAVLGLQINLHDSTLSNNTFNGNQTAACLQLFGSQFGLVPSQNVTVSGNTFKDCGANTAPWNYAVQLSQNITDITITGNTIENAYEAVNTRVGDGWDFTGKNIHVNDNSITASRNMAVNNSVAGTLDASNNWWGSPFGPGVGEIAGAVETSPWCADDTCSSTHSATNGVANLGANPLNLFETLSGNQAVLPGLNGITIEGSTPLGIVSVSFAQSTTIEATGGIWDGIIHQPATQPNGSVSVPATFGFSNTVAGVVEIGSSNLNLSFDKPVRILLPGQAGKLAGFVQAGGTFDPITTPCLSDNLTSATDLLQSVGAPDECRITSGSDLVIWTTHLTKFVTYSQTLNPASTGSATINPSAAAGVFRPAFFGSAGDEVLSANSTTPQTSSTATKAKAAQSTSPDVKTDSSGKLLGLMWYWWLVILLLSGSALYGIYRLADTTEHPSR